MNHWALVLLLSRLFAPLPWAIQEQPPAVQERASSLIVPNERTQLLLSELTRAARERQDVEPALVYARYDELRQLYDGNYEELVRQLLYYAVTVENNRRSEVLEAMLPRIVLDFLKVPNSIVVSAAVPYLNVEDRTLRKVAREILYTTEGSGGRPDLSHYASALREPNGEAEGLRRPLVLYLVERDVGEAVKTILRVTTVELNEYRAILWAEHEVADVLWKWQYAFLPKDVVEAEAKDALIAIADSPHWWVRLYVAEIMKRYPPFRTDEVMAALIVDSDESVRSTALSVVDDETR